MHDSTKNVRDFDSTYSAKLNPEDLPKKPPDVPYCPVCNAKRRIRRGKSFGRTQDVSLIIIHNMSFCGMVSIFPDSNCISDIVLPK